MIHGAPFVDRQASPVTIAATTRDHGACRVPHRPPGLGNVEVVNSLSLVGPVIGIQGIDGEAPAPVTVRAVTLDEKYPCGEARGNGVCSFSAG